MNKKPTLTWTGYADDEDIKAYADNYNEGLSDGEEAMTIEQASQKIYEDYDYWRFMWESFVECLTEDMEGKRYWIDNAKGMGWRNLEGYKAFEAEDGEKLLQAISPKTECSYRIVKHYNGFKIRISHHDSPMGETHILKPINIIKYHALTL